MKESGTSSGWTELGGTELRGWGQRQRAGGGGAQRHGEAQTQMGTGKITEALLPEKVQPRWLPRPTEGATKPGSLGTKGWPCHHPT